MATGDSRICRTSVIFPIIFPSKESKYGHRPQHPENLEILALLDTFRTQELGGYGLCVPKTRMFPSKISAQGHGKPVDWWTLGVLAGKEGAKWDDLLEPTMTGWCFGALEHLDYFSIYWEESSQLTNIFQRGWNHQPDDDGKNMTKWWNMRVNHVKPAKWWLFYMNISWHCFW